MKGEAGGFAGEDFVKAGELFKQLVDLQPFQNGFLGSKHLPAIGQFADGKAAMTLAISVIYNQQRSIAADKKGASRTIRSAGSSSPSCPAERERRPIRLAGSSAGS